MHSEQGTAAGAAQVTWFFLKARVALAVAIIRTRPQGMSGREHAEALAVKLRSRDESWRQEALGLRQEVLRLRQEALGLRQEVLRLRQEMLVTRATTGVDNTIEAGSQDLFGPETLHLDCDSETPDLILQDPQSAVASPHPPVPSSSFHVAPGNAMQPSVQFLQRLCSLHRVGGSVQGLEALWFSPDGDAGSVLVDSVCQLLDSVVRTCRDPPPPGLHDLVPQACRVAAQAMDLFCSQRLPSVEFKKHVEESLRELTAMLLHSNQPSRASENLAACLVTLGSSSLSKAFVVGHLLSELGDLAEGLWQAFQSSVLGRFPVDQYQNSCYLFRILEELLQTLEVPRRVEVEAEQVGFLRHLERRVFLLSDEFPLFSICMWRIGSLLRE